MSKVSGSQLPYAAQKSAEAAQTLHDDIREKWDKLSDFDVGALSSVDDLVTEVARRYSLYRPLAQREVLGLLNGRTI